MNASSANDGDSATGTDAPYAIAGFVGCWAFQLAAGALFFGSIFGCFRLWPTSYESKYADVSVDWPTTRGEIVSSGISKSYQPTRYRVKVRYVYSAGGRRQSSTRIAFGDLSFAERGPAEALRERYWVGADVDVFYNPERPDIGVLEPGPGGSNGWLSWLGLVVALGVVLWLWIRWSARQDAAGLAGRGRSGAPEPGVDPAAAATEVSDARRRLGLG